MFSEREEEEADGSGEMAVADVSDINVVWDRGQEAVEEEEETDEGRREQAAVAPSMTSYDCIVSAAKVRSFGGTTLRTLSDTGPGGEAAGCEKLHGDDTLLLTLLLTNSARSASDAVDGHAAVCSAVSVDNEPPVPLS